MRTNAVGRTMDGLVGVGGIVGVEGCRINEGRHWARQDLAGSRQARPAMWGCGNSPRAWTLLSIQKIPISRNQCTRAQTPSHECPNTRPRSKHPPHLWKFKTKWQVRGLGRHQVRKSHLGAPPPSPQSVTAYRKRCHCVEGVTLRLAAKFHARPSLAMCLFVLVD